MIPYGTLSVVASGDVYKVINAYGDVLFQHSDKKICQEWRALHA